MRRIAGLAYLKQPMAALFLDEVASLSLAAQAKLLLAIENQKIRRVGGNKDIAIDARIIAAANFDLRKMIAEGKFREDLFHRLDLLRISIPPLSQRSRDLPKLADHFLVTLSQKYHLKKPELDSESIKYLQSHSWPGNNRELLHELERAMVLHEPGTKLSLSSAQLISYSPKDPQASDWLNENFCFPEDGFDLEKKFALVSLESTKAMAMFLQLPSEQKLLRTDLRI